MLSQMTIYIPKFLCKVSVVSMAGPHISKSPGNISLWKPRASVNVLPSHFPLAMFQFLLFLPTQSCPEEYVILSLAIARRKEKKKVQPSSLTSKFQNLPQVVLTSPGLNLSILLVFTDKILSDTWRR